MNMTAVATIIMGFALLAMAAFVAWAMITALVVPLRVLQQQLYEIAKDKGVVIRADIEAIRANSAALATFAESMGRSIKAIDSMQADLKRAESRVPPPELLTESLELLRRMELVLIQMSAARSRENHP